MDIQGLSEPIFVCLGSSIDTLRYYQASSNSKREMLSKPRGQMFVQVKSLKEASDMVRGFIDHFNLGSGEFVGGRIEDVHGNFVARVSYNGRVWDTEE